ncbi:MAG: hypothetical protein KAY82_03805 [Hylemonella sp.]|nr:hypothetical protein [Hylemonella sp.]
MAKQFDNLFEQICCFDNLWLAFKRAAKGKRSQEEVADFECDADLRLLGIQLALHTGTWRPGPYRSFEISDPKRRVVSAAPFADRVVHHALVQVIEPLFERTFIGDSYANRVGKGTHAALDRAQSWVRAYPYVLQCDVKQFFPSVDHVVLLAVLARKIACLPTLDLCQRILVSGDGVLHEEYDMVHFEGDDLLAIHRPRGLPIGNLTSQFWANVLLNELDQFVKRELGCHAYLRYVDDFLLFSANKRELWHWRTVVLSKIASMRLTLHERRATVAATAGGVPFLGFRLFASNRRLKSRNAWAFTHRLRVGLHDVAMGTMALDDLSAKVQGWVAHAEHGNTWRLRERIFDSHPIGLAQVLGQSGDARIPSVCQSARPAGVVDAAHAQVSA